MNCYDIDLLIIILTVDSGWRYGDHSRRSLQGPEHDGLLGSGSFPRPSGYATGFSAPKVRANEQYQLNRSNEPYHPPRPYKVHIIFPDISTCEQLIICL